MPDERREPLAILCVDDRPETCRLNKLLLERNGHRVAVASTGEEALGTTESFIPDAALLDYGLEGISGGELLAQLKTRPALTNCVFISISLSGRREDEVDWREMGFDEYLQKPADVDQMEQAIRKTIGEK